MKISKGMVARVAVIWLILFLSYFGNIFSVGYGDGWFDNYEEYSASIIKKTAECKGEFDYTGPLVPKGNSDFTAVMESGHCDTRKVQPYGSQYGLQARVIAFFAPTNDSLLPSYFKKVEIILAFLTSILLALFIAKIWNIYGRYVGIVVTALLSLSPWVAGYARNLYWVAFLMFLPFILTFLLYPRLKAKKTKAVFYALVTIIIFLKCLDGYEHITTIGLSVFAAVAYWEAVLRKRALKSLWKQLLLAVGITTVALFSAITANVISLQSYYGSWSKAEDVVLSRADDRATGLKKVEPNVILGFEVTDQHTYAMIERFYNLDVLKSGQGNPLKYAALSALNYALLPAVSLPISLAPTLQELIQSMLTVSIIGFLCLKRIGTQARGLIEMYWVGLLGVLSWLVLMPGHAYPHAHLNGIIFYIPFLLASFIAIGIWLQQHILKANTRKRGRQ